MFVSPLYTHPECSGRTVILPFGNPMKVHDLNQSTHYWVWALWLLFCLSVTGFWGILLVFNSSEASHPILQWDDTTTDGYIIIPVFQIQRWAMFKQRLQELWERIKASWPNDKFKRLHFCTNILAIVVVLFFFLNNEVQVILNIRTNCVTQESDWGFGQVAALLLAVSSFPNNPHVLFI